MESLEGFWEETETDWKEEMETEAESETDWEEEMGWERVGS